MLCLMLLTLAIAKSTISTEDDCSWKNLTNIVTRIEAMLATQKDTNELIKIELNMVKRYLAVPKKCPKEFVYNPSLQSCYLFIAYERTWYQARQICQAHKSQLASIESEAEQVFLAGSLASNPSLRGFHYLLSGTDAKKGGQWIWTSTNQAFEYTKWDPGEPNNHKHPEECVVMSSSAGYNWSDVRCTNSYRIICEINLWQKSPITG